VLVTYNPGRRQIGFTPAGDGSQLLGLEELHFPARMGLSLGIPCRIEPGANDEARYVFERGELLLVADVRQARLAHVLLVVRDQAVIAAELDHEPGADGEPVLARVRRVDAFRTVHGLQLQVAERALADLEPDFAPVPIQVRATDNVFLFPPEGGAEFRGRVDTRELPELVRPLVRVADVPRPVWSR
jgi:hypothetical protein